MNDITTIGLDLAKRVFQVHGIDACGEVVIRRQLRRGQVLGFFAALAPCLVGLEACATSHYWGRELRALGHEVRLMAPQYVKAYVKRNKNDAADAEAICEAVSRPSMRYVAIKSVEQQSVLVVHRARDLLVRQRTMLINALRGHMAEFGIAEAQGRAGVKRLPALRTTSGGGVAIVEDEADHRLVALARRVLASLVEQLAALKREIAVLEREIMAWHGQSEVSQRLATIPGIGPITASAIAATAPDPSAFSSARQFAAWLGLVPRQTSSGGVTRLGGISKRGDGYLRRLLMIGATAALQQSRVVRRQPWVLALLERRPKKVVAVALANKMARTAWAVMARESNYRPAAG